MKQLLLSVALSLSCLPVFSQSLSDFVEKYKNAPAFTYAFVSKDFMETTMKWDLDEKDWKKAQNAVRNIGTISVLVSEKQPKAQELFKEATDAMPASLDELLTVRDNKDKVRVLVNMEESKISELVVLVASDEAFVLICFSGALELGDLSELANLFNGDQAESLARTVSASSIDFNISPNPSSGEITLDYANSEGDLPAQLMVFDLQGKPLATLDLSPAPSQQVRLSSLAAGNYWLQVKTQKGKVGIKQLQIIRA
jgi:hypothetical protein